MTFEEMLDQAVAMLRRRGRITYRALKAHFQLDDELLETLKDELLFSHPAIMPGRLRIPLPGELQPRGGGGLGMHQAQLGIALDGSRFVGGRPARSSSPVFSIARRVVGSGTFLRRRRCTVGVVR